MNLLLFFTFFALLGTVISEEWTMCYKCASPYIVNTWTKLQLGRMNPGEEIISEKNCLDSDRVHSTVKCPQECALLTVFGNINGSDISFGVLRDCSTARHIRPLFRRLNPPETSFDMPIPSKRVSRKLRFQTCSSDFCNGIRPTKQRWSSRKHSSTSTTNLYTGTLLLVLLTVM